MEHCRMCGSWGINTISDPKLCDACYYKNHPMNLLAIIHRDGGQYVGKHGMDKAVEDGKQIVVNAIVR